MARPYGLLRAGFPFLKTLAMRRITNFPVDIGLGKEGRMYILCRSEDQALIRKYTFEDEDLGAIALYGSEDGKSLRPVNLIVDKDENLMFSDEALHRITMINTEGEFLSKWGEFGEKEGQLNRPSGIAFDAEENVYVSDTYNHRVQKFTKDGRFLFTWGEFGDKEGQFNMPWGITVDELGDVYVVDWRNNRIQKFTFDGQFIWAYGKSGNGQGEFNRPTDVAVDLDGDIYVADWGNDRVQQLNAEPRYVETFIGDATLSKVAREYMMANAVPNRLRDMAVLEPQKRFRRPKSVIVDEQGHLFISDCLSYRVQVYQKEAIALTPEQFAPPRRSSSLTIL